MLRVTIRGLLARRLRLALTAIAVILGVGFVSGTLILADTMNRSVSDLYTRADRGIDAVVRSQASFVDDTELSGRRPIDAATADRVRAVPGVRAVAGTVLGVAQIVGPDHRAINPANGMTVGLSTSSVPGLSPVSLRQGSLPQGDAQVAVDARTAVDHHIAVGDDVLVIFSKERAHFRVSGIIGFGDSDNLAGATLAAFDLTTAQRHMNRAGLYDEIDVAAAPGVSQQQLRDRIDRSLGGTADVLTGAAYIQQTTERTTATLTFFTLALMVFGAVSLLVGTFIIGNTFAILVAQRTRDIALLRAVGASTRQVVASVLGEALAVGVLASAVGLGLGIGVAAVLRSLLGSIGVSIPDGGLHVGAGSVIAAVAVGVGVTTLASLMPALRTRRILPIEALRDTAAEPEVRMGRRRLVAGALLAAAAIGLLLAGLFGSGDNRLAMVGLGALLSFAATATLSIVVVRPLARGIGAPLVRVLGLGARLGRLNAARNPRRTARTAAALMVGLGLVGFVTIMTASVKASMSRTIDHVIQADIVIDKFGARNSNISPEIADIVRTLPQVEQAGSFQFGTWQDADHNTQALEATQTATLDHLFHIDMVRGSVDDLVPGAVLVSRQVASSRSYHVGDVISMTFPRTGMRHLRVAAIFDNNNSLLHNYLINTLTYRENYTDETDGVACAALRPGVSLEAGRRAIEAALADYNDVHVQSRLAFKVSQNQMLDTVAGVLYALLALAVVIALLGVANTLALSIHERTGELGLLRALGMTPRQVRRTVRSEAVIVALIGATFGLVVGSLFGILTVRALRDHGVTDLAYPVGTVLLVAGAAVVVGVVAAALPARRAARVDLIRALTHP